MNRFPSSLSRSVESTHHDNSYDETAATATTRTKHGMTVDNDDENKNKKSVTEQERKENNNELHPRRESQLRFAEEVAIIVSPNSNSSTTNDQEHKNPIFTFSENDDEDDETSTSTEDMPRCMSAPAQFGRPVSPPMNRNNETTLMRQSPGSVTSRPHDSALWSTYTGDEQDDGEYPISPRIDSNRHSDDADGSSRKVTILGWSLPLCFTNGPTWIQVASRVVRYAPCFCIIRQRLGPGATDRSILLQLNLLCAFFAGVQIASASWWAILLFSEHIVNRYSEHSEIANPFVPNLWNPNATLLLLGMVAVLILFTMVFTLSIVREVDLVWSLRYLWLLLWILPLEIFFVIGMFDYLQVSSVWVKQWWTASTMAYFRELFCADNTYNTKCMVPIDGGLLFSTEEDWCRMNFNATDCSSIRDNAQQSMDYFVSCFFNINGFWGLFTIFLLCLIVGVLEGIITKPIVQASRESNIPLWLSVPTLGCTTVGILLLFVPSSIIRVASPSDSTWIGFVYLLCGCTFFISALLGWFISSYSILNSRDKRTKLFLVYVFMTIMITTVVLIGIIFVVSILSSLDVFNYSMSNEQRGNIACTIDLQGTCTLCGNTLGESQCPQWSNEDVKLILRAELKESATLAAIVLLYSLGALRYGFVLRKHIAEYQIDYV